MYYQKQLEKIMEAAKKQQKEKQAVDIDNSKTTTVLLKPVPLPILPKRLNRFKPIDSISKDWTQIYTKTRNKILDGILVAVYGKRGTGKSQMGVCLIKYCCANARSGLYKKAMEIFLEIRAANKDPNETDYKQIQEYLKPFILVIDAFEVRGESDFEDKILNYIIDKRYDAEKSTIIISNDTGNRFKDVLGESIINRMDETGGFISMDWESLRKK